MRDTKHIGQLNPQAYFCECGIFPKDGDECNHWPDVIERTEPTQTRHFVILAVLGVICVVVLLLGLLAARGL